MSEWKNQTLGNLFTVKNDKTKQLNSSEYQAVGKYPIVDQSNNHICGYSDEISKLYDTNLPVTIFGDHTRHVKYIDFPFIAGADGTQILKPISLDDNFFYYIVLYASEKIGNYGYDRHLKHLREYKAYYPTYIPTQRKIARILSKADAVIEKTQAAIAKYKAIKQGMLHDLFTRGIDSATNKLRPIYEDAPHLYKQSKLGWIPREWEVEKFKNICDLITDGSHFSPKPIEDGAIIANVKDIGEFGIDYESCTRISFEEFDFLKKQNCSPKIGDVLLSKDGTIGRVVLFNDFKEIVILSSIAILRTSLLVNSEYFYSFLKSEYFNKQMLVKTSGSALKRIVLRDINTFLLAYPQNKTEQKNISNRIIKIEKKLQTEQAYLRKLQQIKAGLMADFLSGKKKVTVDDDPGN